MYFEIVKNSSFFFSFEFVDYLNIIDKIPVLTTKEEKIFLLKLKNENDALSVHYLLISHLRYVVKIAKCYLYCGFFLADLVQEGTIGLLKAIKKYDLKKNTKLISFAVYWIKAEIFNYVIKNWSIVKREKSFANNIDMSFFFNKKDNLYENFIVEQVKTIGSVVGYYNNVYVRNNVNFFYSGDKFFFSLIFNEFEIKLILKYLILEILERLNCKKKMLFIQRWLQDDCKVVTFKFLSFYYGISDERIRQYEIQIIKKIRKLLKFFI